MPRPLKSKAAAGKSVSRALPDHETILLAVTGTSPAILTETIWALAMKDGVIPGEVRILTTTVGKAAIQRELLDAPPGGALPVWDDLRTALKKMGFAVEDNLRLSYAVIQRYDKPRARYEDLPDIRDEAENQAAADFLLKEVRNAVETPGSRVIASIAGGRKTMGALLYSCMTLLGRPTDRLTHVLVAEPFDSALEPRFYFPAQRNQQLEARDAVNHTASKADIQLADIPFLALRNLFERDLIQKPATYTQLVERCREKITDLAKRECKLEIRDDLPEVLINGTSVTLPIRQYVLVRWLCDQAGKSPIEGAKAAADSLRPYAESLHNRRDKNRADWRSQIVPGDIDDRWVTKTISELKVKLKQLGPEVACLIPLLPRGHKIHLDLPQSAISRC